MELSDGVVAAARDSIERVRQGLGDESDAALLEEMLEWATGPGSKGSEDHED